MRLRYNRYSQVTTFVEKNAPHFTEHINTLRGQNAELL
jgi:hypothetical protein